MIPKNSDFARGAAIVAKAAIAKLSHDPTIATIATIAGRLAQTEVRSIAATATIAGAPSQIQIFDDDQIEFEERAAILEFLGGFPRAEAERRAHKELQQ
jgi:hypothetical protein